MTLKVFTRSSFIKGHVIFKLIEDEPINKLIMPNCADVHIHLVYPSPVMRGAPLFIME